MVEWDARRLGEIVGEEIIKRFHLAREKDHHMKFMQLRNTASISNGVLYADYFGYKFKVRLKENGGEYLVIDVSSPKKGVEELAHYVERDVGTGTVFSHLGILRVIGERRQFGKYNQRLEYVGAEETRVDDEGRDLHHPVLRVSYKINKRVLAKLNHESFKETVSDYAIKPLMGWVLLHRN